MRKIFLNDYGKELLNRPKEIKEKKTLYSEEEVLDIIYKYKQSCPYFIEEWFNKIKKK